MVLFAFAAVWLVTASFFGLIVSLKFHMPGLLADRPWFTYGRAQAAQLNSFLYGFAAVGPFVPSCFRPPMPIETGGTTTRT